MPCICILWVDFSCSLFRLQQELNKLILRHTEQITDPVAKGTKQSSIYEVLLQGLIVSPLCNVQRAVCKHVYCRRGRVSHPTPKLRVSSVFGRKRKRELEELSFLRAQGDSPRNKYATMKWKMITILRGSEYKLAKDALDSKILDSQAKFMDSKEIKERSMQFQGLDKSVVGLELFNRGRSR